MEIRSVRAALAALEKMVADGMVHGAAAQAVRASYDARLEAAEKRSQELRLEGSDLAEEEEHVARRHSLQVEKQVLLADSLKGVLGAEAYEVTAA